MQFLMGLGILAGLVWFAFGARTARVIVGAVLTVPIVLGVLFVTGELTRGLDGVAFSKLYKSDEEANREAYLAKLLKERPALELQRQQRQQTEVAVYPERVDFDALAKKFCRETNDCAP